MSKHYLLQKLNGIIVQKTVKDWAREPQNQKKFPKYSFNRPFNTNTTPTSEEIDAQLHREGCKRELFNGDYYCYNLKEISENDLLDGNFKRLNLSDLKNETHKRMEIVSVSENKKQTQTILNSNIKSDLIENIKQYIENNSTILFKTLPDKPLSAIFDDKGFFFADETQKKYDKICSEPHLYIAYRKDIKETTYIGKSFQSGGRWKRSHAYHLGTLAHHLNNTIRYDDQNHAHWINAWMDVDSTRMNSNKKTINLLSEVLIAFIPFQIYSNENWRNLDKQQIREINHTTEHQLISAFANVGLLNVLVRESKKKSIYRDSTFESYNNLIKYLDWDKIQDKNERKLLIICCADSKNIDGVKIPENNIFNNQDLYNNLIDARILRNAQYNQLRNNNFDYFIKYRNGLGNVNVEYFNEQLQNPLFMPAFKRYDGIFYSPELRKLYIEKNRDSNLHILIISGLYGVLEFRDSIIDYHLEINRIPFWTQPNNISILNAVKKYIEVNDISNEMVFYSLSNIYNDALKPIEEWINLWIPIGRGHTSARFLEQEFLPRL